MPGPRVLSRALGLGLKTAELRASSGPNIPFVLSAVARVRCVITPLCSLSLATTLPWMLVRRAHTDDVLS